MKALAKITALALSAVMAASAFGCGSSDSTQAANPGFEPQDIQINDPGYFVSDEGMLNYAFLAVNPNDGHVANDVLFTIEAYDANGSMIAGTSQTISALYPGSETPGAGETELFSQKTRNPEVASFSIVAIMDSITWTDSPITNADLEDSIEIANSRMSTGDNGDINIKADIQLSEGDDMKLDASKPIELRAVALLFNSSGQAIAGTEPVIFTLDPNSESYSYTAVIANPPAYAQSNLYVTPTA